MRSATAEELKIAFYSRTLRCQDKNLHIFISQKDAAGGSGAVLYSTVGAGEGRGGGEGGVTILTYSLEGGRTVSVLAEDLI